MRRTTCTTHATQLRREWETEGDGFLIEQLKPELLAEACAAAGIDLTLRMQAGYDHSYNFISTFMSDHVAWHAERLG